MLFRALPNSSRPFPQRPLPLVLVGFLLLGGLVACSGPGSKADASDPNALGTRASAPSRAASPTMPPAPATTEPLAPTATATRDALVSPTVAVTTTATATQTVDDPTPTISSIDQTEFAQQVDQLVAAAGGTTEVVVALADGTIIYDYNGAESMESASLYKLGVMVELYRQRDAGLLTFDDGVYMYPGFFAEGEDVYGASDIGTTIPISDLLQNMITLSSNVAAAALLDRAGTDNINNTLASLGLTGTEIRWTPGYDLPTDAAPDNGSGGVGPIDPNLQQPGGSDTPLGDVSATGRASRVILTAAEPNQPRPVQRPIADARADAALNVTTASDLASLYQQLLRGEVVNAQASQEMLDLLAQQEINDRLPLLLPADTVVAHKTGNLDGLVHDAGVIYAPAEPIIVSVLTEDVDEGVADDMIAQIGLLAYQLAS